MKIQFLSLSVIIFLLGFSIPAKAEKLKTEKTTEAKAKEWVKNKPLEFIENKGQLINTEGKPADNVLFKTSFGSCDIYITQQGLSYVFVKTAEKDKEEIEKEKKMNSGEDENEESKKIMYYRLDMNLVGANIQKSNIIKEEESKQGHYNYFYPHCPKGIYDVKGYGKVTIKDIYPGIDWVLYSNTNSKEHPLKYDFVVHPGADYNEVKIKFKNIQNMSLLENDKKLKIETIAGNIEEGELVCYSNEKEEISSKYVIENDSLISFEIGDYDKAKTLIIDPLVWATYYGGGTSYDGFKAICTDSHDNIYIAGYSNSTNFPTLELLGAYWQATISVYWDAAILKFSPQGQRLWATCYGGNRTEYASSIAVDSQNSIFITGNTNSTNFPIQQLTASYWQDTLGGQDSLYDIFLLKFDSLGVRQWATYYGGSAHEEGNSIRIDNQDNVYMVGTTSSSNLPTQQLTGAYWQATYGGNNDFFILKFNNMGVRQWATYYGGTGIDANYNQTSNCLAIDSQNNVYITGNTSTWGFPTQQLTGAYWQANGTQDIVILKFNSQGVRQWATYYGGTSEENGISLCIDIQDNLFITGYTSSANFPTQQFPGSYWQDTLGGSYDMFILKFNNSGVREWATYYGGSSNDQGTTVFSDKKGSIYITGFSQSDNFPLKQLAGEYWQSTFAGLKDAILLKFNNQGFLDWSTYYGTYAFDWGTSIANDNNNSVYFIGEWPANGAYTVNPGNGAYYDSSWNGDDDSYILKFKPCHILSPTITQNGNILTSNFATGNQWCNQNGIIVGAINQDYTFSTNGEYYVIVSEFACPSDTSNVIYITNVGINENENSNIHIYPNPIANELIIEAIGNNEKIEFEIINTIGQVVYKGSLLKKTIVQTRNFVQGIYVVKLGNGKKFEFKKVVKE